MGQFEGPAFLNLQTTDTLKTSVQWRTPRHLARAIAASALVPYVVFRPAQTTCLPTTYSEVCQGGM